MEISTAMTCPHGSERLCTYKFHEAWSIIGEYPRQTPKLKLKEKQRLGKLKPASFSWLKQLKFHKRLMCCRWWAGNYAIGKSSNAWGFDLVVHCAVEFRPTNDSRTRPGVPRDGPDQDTSDGQDEVLHALTQFCSILVICAAADADAGRLSVLLTVVGMMT